MKKYKLIQFLKMLGLYNADLGVKIDNSQFNIEDIMLNMVSAKLSIDITLVELKYTEFECDYS